jgi:hypothetical protein
MKIRPFSIYGGCEAQIDGIGKNFTGRVKHSHNAGLEEGLED